MSVAGIRLAFSSFNRSHICQMDAEEMGLLTWLWFKAWEHRSALLPGSVNAESLSEELHCTADPILHALAHQGRIIFDPKGRIDVLMSAESNVARFKKAKPPPQPPAVMPALLEDLEELKADSALCRDFGKLAVTWKQRFPLIDLRKELIKANGWLTDNPDQKRPSKSRFLANWFRKAQTTAERSWRGGAPANEKASLKSWEGKG